MPAQRHRPRTVRRPPPTDPDPAPAPARSASAWEAIGVLGGEFTLVSGTLVVLVVYFGRQRFIAMAEYLGLDQTIFENEITGYALRSVDVLFPVLALSVGLVLLAYGAQRVLHPRLEAWLGGDPLRRRTVAVTLFCAPLFAIAVAAGFAYSSNDDWLHLVLPVLLTASVPVVAYGAALARPGGAVARRRPVRALVATLVVMGMFWSTTEFAVCVGHGQARALEKTVARRTVVVLYSKADLHIPDRRLGMRATRLRDGTYLYWGLRLFTRERGRLYLLPRQAVDASRLYVVPEDKDLLVQYGGHARAGVRDG